jgi:3-oxoacyl-[acyl-carrier-protein] synthase-3
MKKHVDIVATGGYLPGDPITTEEIESLVGPLTPELLSGISIKRRFWMIDPKTGAHKESLSEMAHKAVKLALDSCGIEAKDVDLMIMATGTPEYPLPQTVNLVQEKMGLERCSTIELRSGGAGGVQGLDIARFYLEQGTHRTAIVIGGEAISPAMVPIFLNKTHDSIRMRERLPLYMFGDGAGAFVLRARDGGEPGMLPGASESIGGTRKPGIWAIGGGSHAPVHEQVKARRFPELRVDVVESGKFTPYMITRSLSETLRNSGLSADQVDLCMIPEGNVNWMLEELEEAGLMTPEWKAMEGKIFDNLAMTGAVGCAAVPLFVDEAWRTGKIKPGHRVMLIGVEATKWIYAGIVMNWMAPTPKAKA